MSLSLIAAVAQNGVIGKANDLPWKLSADLKRFSTITKNHTVVMGLNTFKSIVMRLGKPLPNRNNIIITADKDFDSLNCEVISDFNTWAKEASASNEELFVIGGAMLYRSALPYASKLYLTEVKATVDGDAFFPVFDEKEWAIVKEETFPKDVVNEYDTIFRIYERK